VAASQTLPISACVICPTFCSSDIALTTCRIQASSRASGRIALRMRGQSL
jgi:hypothetical protein